MKGNVSGLPTDVPSAEASIDPRRTHAMIAEMMKWKPMKGVNDVKAPQAKPSAILCGDAEMAGRGSARPGRAMTVCLCGRTCTVFYLAVLRQW